jgi:transposase
VPGLTPRYPLEFKEEALRLVRSLDRSIPQVAKELGVSDNTLRNWVKQAQIDEADREGFTTQEREELKKLRKEVKVLRQEREILRKAGRPSSPERRTGYKVSTYELIDAERASFSPSRLCARCSQGLKQRLLRLEGSSAIEKEPGRRRPLH